MGHELQWQTLLSVLRRQIRQTWLPKRARAFSALPCFFTSIKIKRLDGALTPGYPELPLPLDQFILAPVPRGAVRLVPMEGIRWRWGSLHCTELSCVRTCVSAMLHSCCPAPPRAARDLRCHVGSSARPAASVVAPIDPNALRCNLQAAAGAEPKQRGHARGRPCHAVGRRVTT